MEAQYPPALMRAEYGKIKHPATGQKYYLGEFLMYGRLVKRTRRMFKRAADAELYARIVLMRYRRLLEAVPA